MAYCNCLQLVENTLSREDATLLRQLAQRALQERDQEHMLRQQAERRSRHLQSDTEALGGSLLTSHRGSHSKSQQPPSPFCCAPA